MVINAAVVRLMAALNVLREAPPERLAQHADALNVALRTIDDLVIEVAESYRGVRQGVTCH
jgi:hypothetical protein